MRPIFTIHAGEYLVGNFIEHNLQGLDVWIPAKDSGVDLLITGANRRRSIALQVKFSRDFLVTHMKPSYQPTLRACGWWTLKRSSLARSNADLWVLVLMGFQHRTTDYLVVRPKELLRRLDRIHGKVALFQCYLWVSVSGECWETRGLRETERLSVAAGTFSAPARKFSRHLNDWTVLRRLATIDALRPE